MVPYGRVLVLVRLVEKNHEWHEMMMVGRKGLPVEMCYDQFGNSSGSSTNYSLLSELGPTQSQHVKVLYFMCLASH